jgi:hypothetical protein
VVAAPLVTKESRAPTSVQLPYLAWREVCVFHMQDAQPRTTSQGGRETDCFQEARTRPLRPLEGAVSSHLRARSFACFFLLIPEQMYITGRHLGAKGFTTCHWLRLVIQLSRTLLSGCISCQLQRVSIPIYLLSFAQLNVCVLMCVIPINIWHGEL